MPATVRDDEVKRYRPVIVMAEGAGDGLTFAQRAEWQKSVGIGKSKRATYTMRGWRANGKLWQPNTLVKVTDDWCGLEDYELLIATVTQTLDDSGMITELELTPREAYAVKPAKVTATGARSGNSSASSGGADNPFTALWR